MEIGNIVEYDGKEWYLYDIYGDNLCQIVRLRNGKYTNEKNGEIRLNANIVNLNIEKIRKK
jgi:hypothetical protein